MPSPRICFGVVLVSLLAGCKKGDAEGQGDASVSASAAAPAPADALVEMTEQAKLSWVFDGAGKVLAFIETPDGKAASKGATGTLAYSLAAGEPKTVDLTYDESAGALVAKGPKLESDLTQVDYKLNVDGKPVTGVLHVPAGGTSPIAAATGGTTANAGATPAADKAEGPHGGVVQIVGGDRLEVVANGKDEVRVHVLDAEGKPVSVGTRKVKLGILGDKSQVVVLTPEPGGMYLTGAWSGSGEPTRLTLVEEVDGKRHVALVGYRPGQILLVGKKAPRFKVVGAGDRWNTPVIVSAAGVKLQGNGNPIGTGMGKGRGNGKDKDNGGGNGKAKR